MQQPSKGRFATGLLRQKRANSPDKQSQLSAAVPLRTTGVGLWLLSARSPMGRSPTLVRGRSTCSCSGWPGEECGRGGGGPAASGARLAIGPGGRLVVGRVHSVHRSMSFPRRPSEDRGVVGDAMPRTPGVPAQAWRCRPARSAGADHLREIVALDDGRGGLVARDPYAASWPEPGGTAGRGWSRSRC